MYRLVLTEIFFLILIDPDGYVWRSLYWYLSIGVFQIILLTPSINYNFVFICIIIGYSETIMDRYTAPEYKVRDAIGMTKSITDQCGVFLNIMWIKAIFSNYYLITLPLWKAGMKVPLEYKTAILHTLTYMEQRDAHARRDDSLLSIPFYFYHTTTSEYQIANKFTFDLISVYCVVKLLIYWSKSSTIN